MIPQLRSHPATRPVRVATPYRFSLRSLPRFLVQNRTAGLALLTACTTRDSVPATAALHGSEGSRYFTEQVATFVSDNAFTLATSTSVATVLLAGGLCYATQDHPLFGYFDIRKTLGRIQDTYARLKLEHLELPRLYDDLISDEASLRAQSQHKIKELGCEEKAANFLIEDLFEKVENHHHIGNKPSKSWHRESNKYRDFFTRMGPDAAIPVLLKAVQSIQAWFKTITTEYPLMFNNPNIGLTIDLDDQGEMTTGTLIMATAYRRILMTFLEILAQWKTPETRALFEEMQNFDVRPRAAFNFSSQREVTYFAEVRIPDVQDFAARTLVEFSRQR